jgi:CoA-transferase family III
MKAPGANEFLDERIGNEVPVLRGGEDKLNQPNYLEGIRVIELADELGEYAGKVLAGLGADVIKVEAPTGETTRQYGPFAADEPGIENSLYFWHYNLGKRGIVLDLDKNNERDEFVELVQGADVLIDSRRRGFLASRRLNDMFSGVALIGAVSFAVWRQRHAVLQSERSKAGEASKSFWENAFSDDARDDSVAGKEADLSGTGSNL